MYQLLLALLIISNLPVGLSAESTPSDSNQAYATVNIMNVPRQAVLYVNGNRQSLQNNELRLGPGAYQFTLKAEDYHEWSRRLRLTANDVVELKADMQPLQTQEPERVAESTTGLVFIKIPGGRFQMGSPTNEPNRDQDERQHRVTVDSFYMSTTEVTQKQFVTFLNAVKQRGSEYEPWFDTHNEDHDSKIMKQGDKYVVQAGYQDHPVFEVSWFGAMAFAAWLSRETGHHYRLPTEAQWEYAARAGTQTPYWWGSQLPECDQAAANGAKFDDDAQCDDTGTEPVKHYQANPWGLYDVHGNVWEWTCSAYQKEYNGNETRCQLDGFEDRVYRGGSWYDEPHALRVAERFDISPDSRNDGIGFRLVRMD